MSEENNNNLFFRQAAVNHQNNRWLGQALLITKVPAWLVLLSSSLVILSLLLFIIFAQYTRRINVSGEVISNPHAMNVFAPQQGFIAKIFYHSGQYVKKGSPLLEIDVSRHTKTGNVSQLSVAAIEQQLQKINRINSQLEQNKVTHLASLEQQLKKYHSAHQASQAMLDTAKQGVHDMRKMADDYAIYLKQGLVSREQVNNLKYLYYEQQMSVENLNAQLLQQSIQMNDLEKEITAKRIEFDNQILQYQMQYNDLQRQLAEVKATGLISINAPRDGYIENMSVTSGQMVNTGDNLIQLTAHHYADFNVVLWIPNQSIPYLRVGDKVNLRYAAFPYEKFGQFAGTIKLISHVPASPSELSQYGSAPKANSANYYKVLIQPTKYQIPWQGHQISLSSGMQTQATLFLEQRPLYQWMIAPFYAIKTSISGAVDE